MLRILKKQNFEIRTDFKNSLAFRSEFGVEKIEIRLGLANGFVDNRTLFRTYVLRILKFLTVKEVRSFEKLEFSRVTGFRF